MEREPAPQVPNYGKEATSRCHREVKPQLSITGPNEGLIEMRKAVKMQMPGRVRAGKSSQEVNGGTV